MKVQSFKELKVWQRSIELADIILECIEGFPKKYTYSLANQIERSAVSIASNIAEGYNRSSRKEFIQYLAIARGSIAELETQLIIANRRQLVDDDRFKILQIRIEEINKMLWSMRDKLSKKLIIC